jgi:hypothetical protein
MVTTRIFDGEQNDFSVETCLRVDRFQDGSERREGKRRREENGSGGSAVDRVNK